MTKPVEVLKTRAQIVNEKCVDVCRDLLAQAVKGEIQSVFIVSFEPGGDYRVMVSETINTLKKVGALERLKFDFLAGAE